MFEINDYIIYGGNGVHKVLNIGTLDIQGIDKERLYYTLKPMFSNGGYYSEEVEDFIVKRLEEIETV